MQVEVTRSNYGMILDQLRGLDRMSVDTETTGLEYHDRLFAIIIGTAQHEYYFDRRTLSDSFLVDGNFRELFIRGYCTYIFQNAKFDMEMMYRDGIQLLGKIADINVLARLVRNDHLQYGLAAQAQRYGMAKSDEVKEYVAKHKLYEERRTYLGETYKSPRYDWVPIDIMNRYACLDARLTYDLHAKYMLELPNESRDLWETEQRITPKLWQMENRGIRVDFDKTLRAKEYESGLVLEAKQRFHSLTGYHYDENNRNTLIKVFTEAGEDFEYTDKGNPIVDKAALKRFRSPAAAIVREIRHYEKRISTYYDAFLNHADHRGFLHARIWQGGTTTGRFSYSDPNLQNIPKEDDDADLAKPFVVRECLVPRDGHFFLSVDYSQMEYRLMLDYAKELRLIEEVMNGKDMHEATAELLKILRKAAKTTNFAALYGAGAVKLSQMLGISIMDARQLLARYFMGLPNVEKFVDGVKATARGRGYVRGHYGRRFYCKPGFDYAMPNHLIQGTCSDVVRAAIDKLEAPLLLQVHDQLVFEPEIGTPRDVLAGWQEIMETVYVPRNGMQLKADPSYSLKSFAERDMTGGLCESNN